MTGAPEIKLQLVDMMASALSVPPDTIKDDFSSDTCENWDSVRHLTLVLAIEDKFGVTFEEDEIWSLLSLAALTKALETRLSA
jgi:acyl carrier protein